MIKVFKNFKEKKTFKPDFGAEGELLLSRCCRRRRVRACVCVQCPPVLAVSQASSVASCWA